MKRFSGFVVSLLGTPSVCSAQRLLSGRNMGRWCWLDSMKLYPSGGARKAEQTLGVPRGKTRLQSRLSRWIS